MWAGPKIHLLSISFFQCIPHQVCTGHIGVTEFTVNQHNKLQEKHVKGTDLEVKDYGPDET